MAQVKPHRSTFSDVDRQIATAIGDWEDIAEVAVEWTAKTEDEQFFYFVDWPVAEERTQRLLALAPTLPPDDPRAVNLRELRTLVERNRPILERMRSGPIKSWD